MSCGQSKHKARLNGSLWFHYFGSKQSGDCIVKNLLSSNWINKNSIFKFSNKVSQSFFHGCRLLINKLKAQDMNQHTSTYTILTQHIIRLRWTSFTSVRLCALCACYMHSASLLHMTQPNISTVSYRSTFCLPYMWDVAHYNIRIRSPSSALTYVCSVNETLREWTTHKQAGRNACEGKHLYTLEECCSSTQQQPFIVATAASIWFLVFSCLQTEQDVDFFCFCVPIHLDSNFSVCYFRLRLCYK